MTDSRRWNYFRSSMIPSAVSNMSTIEDAKVVKTVLTTTCDADQAEE